MPATCLNQTAMPATGHGIARVARRTAPVEGERAPAPLPAAVAEPRPSNQYSPNNEDRSERRQTEGRDQLRDSSRRVQSAARTRESR